MALGKRLVGIMTLSLILIYFFYQPLPKKYFQQPWIIFDLKGLELSAQEIEMLQHPAVAGIILNHSKTYGQPHIGGSPYPSLKSVKTLVSQIKSIRQELLVMIDYEGGRIQRISDPILPNIPILKPKYDLISDNLAHAKQLGHTVGQILKLLDIDCLLGPVVDQDIDQHPLAYRAISQDPEIIYQMAQAYIQAVQSHGIQTTLKHYPGLGHAMVDTHTHTGHDPRAFADISQSLQPFERLIDCTNSMIMTSHGIFDQIDSQPASQSRYWIERIKRHHKTLKIISDDVSMQGAFNHLSFEERLENTYAAGSDFVICMHRQDQLYEYLTQYQFIMKERNIRKIEP
ncbi:glycoside hydrolase family 3 N-terminal domain-containing protein [Candidatus Synchoanobacter obligatus]|uniref:beta-N-acetylhexosaminidase n=1 Tax=Candidatus Synchoanobacter obligatus TaxID=2919597 RepID=A0ABT1L547_9GAMM|nr:glycoside hydrolase family 3 N-terminal domain-containing protein [Candidatus Synchoanobacter obligatus]MCP8352302.1 hypothetical protein [Candidatus Synchoanobacter obligatus]